nr:hypothetical protein [Tanacetum cinerariifolium]
MAFISLANTSSGKDSGKRLGKKITIHGTDVAGFDKSKVECIIATRWATLLGSAGHPGAKTWVEDKTTNKIKKEKEGLDSKLTGFKSASKDLDTLLGSQRSDKNKEGLGYSVVPPSCSSLLSFQERYVLDWIA